MHLDTMEQIRKRVLEDMDLSEENDDARLREKIEEKVWEHGKCHLISLEEEQRYVQEIFCSLRKLDVLEELLQDESVTEIMQTKISCADISNRFPISFRRFFMKKPDDYIHGTSSLREEKNWRMSYRRW